MSIKLTGTLEGDLIVKITKVKPGLHISRKDRKHMVANTFLSFPGMPWSSHSCKYSYFSKEIFANDILATLKPSLEHDCKHVLQLLRLYGDQA